MGIENHNNIQKAEITEMCDTVEKSINETKETLFKKYLENNSEYSFFKSTATTLIKQRRDYFIVLYQL
ncbi:hypothetical protein DXC58_18125 [Ruminococcus sp. TF06-23]|nr:hypothetical protein DXC58_18125 [Ruminococcus sp. TF06-23]